MVLIYILKCEIYRGNKQNHFSLTFINLVYINAYSNYYTHDV
jgi:hypothetical protein